jgi:hypothetical protein
VDSTVPAIETIKSLVAAVLDANRTFHGQVWWRGQRSSNWDLTASVYRHPNNAFSERSLVERFRHKAPSRHMRVPAHEDLAGWLFLMQHYRLPTRLLDWTESPLIACYFAAEVDPATKDHADVIQDTDGFLFALSPYQLNLAQIGKRSLLMPHDHEAAQSIHAAFEPLGNASGYAIAIRPSEVDPRLMVQLSVFTLHGTDLSLNALPQSSRFLRQWRVPASAKCTLRKELKFLGIRESSVFPDLEHLANDIASTKFRVTPPPGDALKEDFFPAASGEESS